MLYYSGNDDRTLDSYQKVTKRELKWSTTPNNVISVDIYGRVETLSIGEVVIRVESEHNLSAVDSKKISVIASNDPISLKNTKKRVVDYEGIPVKPKKNPQKIV